MKEIIRYTKTLILGQVIKDSTTLDSGQPLITETNNIIAFIQQEIIYKKKRESTYWHQEITVNSRSCGIVFFAKNKIL